jgi:hypothetical protein
VSAPTTRYAKSGDLNIAFQVVGDGSLDLVFVPGFATGDRTMAVESGRHLSRHIPGARMVELPGDDHLPWVGDTDALVDEIEEFLTGVRHGTEPDRVLATVLFSDIVGSTGRAAALGDHRWREILDEHSALVVR